MTVAGIRIKLKQCIVIQSECDEPALNLIGGSNQKGFPNILDPSLRLRMTETEMKLSLED